MDPQSLGGIMGKSSMTRLSVGDRVVDTDDNDPSEGIVISRPPEQMIEDWEFSTDDGTKTTADTNPEYPADTQLVIVAFKNALNGYWPEWEEADPDDLFAGVRANGVHHYGFPEPRLAPVNHSENASPEGEETTKQREMGEETGPPDKFTPVIERLEQNDFSIAYDATVQELQVEKYGVEHTIGHDGSVQGESGIKGRIETIVNRFL
jgi:hypothetical protein